MNWGLDTNYDETGLTIGFQSWIVRTISRINNKSGFVPDDYRTGTWTPSVGGTSTYSAQTGTYTKIGRAVHARFSMSITLIGTGSTSVISGLPFASADTYSGVVGYWSSLALTPVYLSFFTSGTTVAMTGTGVAAAALNTNYAVFGNGAVINGNVTYFV